MVLTSFAQLESLVRNAGEPRRMAVAVAADAHTLEAVTAARAEGLVSPVLVGDKAKILDILNEMGETVPDADIYDEPDEVAACEKAVALVREGVAAFLMKGKVDTKVILKAVVNREHGLGVPGAIMSHVTCIPSVTTARRSASSPAPRSRTPRCPRRWTPRPWPR